MNSESVKGKPLTREETKYLLDLIESSKIIASKTTNAANNKMKNDEWDRLSTKFNANATNCPRTPQQIRLKWENLKKNARKRSAKIRMNQFKTGGGPPEYIPPDDILDRVTSLLGSKTNKIFSVPFGGDREDLSVTLNSQGCEAVKVIGDGGSSGDGFGKEITDNTDLMLVDSGAGTVNSDGAGSGVVVNNCQILENIKKRQSSNTPRTGRSHKAYKQDDKRTVRNQAIADFYIAKKKCLDAKMQNIQLENEGLKLKNIALKLQNDKLLFETEKIKLELEKLRNQQ